MSVAMENRNQPVTTAVRAFIAPVRRETGLPTIFAASQAAAFELENPPEPWIAIGTVENFRRSDADEALSVQSGTDNAVVAQFRRKLESHVTFDLRTWGKLQMALAGGGTHWNVLEPLTGAPSAAIGGEAISAQPLLPGSTATLLKLDPQGASRFAAGDIIAVDVDYMQQTGYVGLGIAGAYIAPSQQTRPSSEFTRRVTFNVARIASIEGGDLHLESALLAGDPPSSAAIQKIVGFADREGGAFRQEWSVLFFEETVSGGRVCYYYPRLQSVPPGSEHKSTILGEFQSLLLQAHMLALPATDPQDGVAALWYRVYVPSTCGA
jgi:hypothetical protein